MSIPNPYSQYQQNAVLTASPPQLVLMLYGGAARFVRAAVNALEKDDLEGAHNNNIRAQEIILHLNETLNEEIEVAKGLRPLYDYLYRRLVEANAKKDRTILEEVLGFVEGLQDTWCQAMQKAAAQEQEKR